MVSLPEHLAKGPVGDQPLSRNVIEEQQRNRILDAATGIFAKRGYRSTTVDHIVSGAKIGVGTFYSHFAGKEDCFLQAYELNLAFGRERVYERLPADAEWPQMACSALLTVLELIAAEPLRARLILVEAQTAGDPALDRYEATIDELVPVLRRGREHSPFVEDLPESLEVAILGGLLWFLQQRVVLGELEGLEQRLPEVANIVLEPYLAEEGTGLLVESVVGGTR